MTYNPSKEFVKKIIEEECKKYGINVNVIALTNIENLIYILTKELKIVLKSDKENQKTFFKINLNKRTHAYYEEDTNTIKVLLSNLKNDNIYCRTMLDYIVQLALTIYHEFDHALYYHEQNNKEDLTLDRFCYQIEDEVIAQYPELYNNYDNEFLLEITANRYAFNHVNALLKKYYNIYEKVSTYLQTQILFYEIQYINYDIEKIINKTNINKDTLLNGQELNKDLILNPDWTMNEFDTKATILSSRIFLENINYQDLTKEELEELLSCLNHILKKEYIKEQLNIELHKKIDDYQKEYPNQLVESQNLKTRLLKKQQRNNSKVKYLKHQIEKITNEQKYREFIPIEWSELNETTNKCKRHYIKL